MKNQFRLLLPTFIGPAICAIFLFSCSPGSERQNDTTAAAVRNDLPEMTITTFEGDQLSVKDLQGKVILILFQPDCEDCQREAVQIRDNVSTFEGYHLFFISSAPIPQINAFANYYGMQSVKDLTFAQVPVQDVFNTLGQIPAPSIYIYNNGKLVKSFSGEVGIDQVKKFL